MKTENPERRNQWLAVYPVYPHGHSKAGDIILNSLPVDWICLCTSEGVALNGARCCPRCGRVPLAHPLNGRLDQSQHVVHTRDDKKWKKFAKGRD
jgi:hypothetical protein